MRTLIRWYACAAIMLGWTAIAAGRSRRPKHREPSRTNSRPQRAGSRSLTARTCPAGHSAILVPRRSGSSAIRFGSIRRTPLVSCRSAAAGSAGSVLLCGDDGRGSDIMTAEMFADYQLHIEFTVPKGSNSGVYNRGLFEIQVFDSFGKPKLGLHDCGALYERAFPRENLAKPPGEWQSYDITLKGKKLSLVWNGKTVYQDQGRPLRRDRPRGVRAAQPGKREQAAGASGQASRGERAVRRLLRRGGHAVGPRWSRPARADPPARRSWPGRLSEYHDSTTLETCGARFALG